MSTAQILERFDAELLRGTPDETPGLCSPPLRRLDGAALIQACLEAEADLAARGEACGLRRRGPRLVPLRIMKSA